MAGINETELKVFIDSVTHYFSHLTQESAEVRSAYLNNASIPQLDYTGLISITGQYRGCVYFTTTERCLRKLLRSMRESDLREENLLDAVGEIANTIAGNARRHFGNTLLISVPQTMRGAVDKIGVVVRARPYSIMLSWAGHDAVVIVDIELDS
ncbi:MAG: chemotaxis protein CheX [Gammaproteobacteria bacterium]|nr:chemotaxis protein CheX [Gammaproteobacteria bacterium]